jgi:hypothetical protein
VARPSGASAAPGRADPINEVIKMTTALQLAGGRAIALERGNPEFEACAAHMADEYREATAIIRACAAKMEEQGQRLERAFADEPEQVHNRFGVQFSYRYSHRPEKIDAVLEEMKRNAWRMLFDRLGVKKVMSVKKRHEFEERLEKGELPEITAEAIVEIILAMVDQLGDFAVEAAKEVFEILRPASLYGQTYKTNSAFRVGKRVILSWYVEPGSRGSFHVNYSREASLIAIDGVFHVMDGKGALAGRRGPLVEAINACVGGVGETEYFRFKCFKNRNLHLEFKRLDLVKQLNFLGAGERVLGKDGA